MSEVRQRRKEKNPAAEQGVAHAGTGQEPSAAPSKAAAVKAVTSSAPETASDDDSFLERNPTLAGWFAFLVAICTRYYRLDKPGGVVFDESHFGRFTNQYNAGTYFFDIHPPLGKLVFYFISRAVNYDHTVCDYTHIDTPYDTACKFIWLRFTAAFFGCLTVPAVFYIAKRLAGGSVRAGLLAAFLLTFDGLNLIESRLVLIDSQLGFWCAATLALGLKWFDTYNAHTEAVIEVVEAPTGRSLTYAETLLARSYLKPSETVSQETVDKMTAAVSSLKADPRFMTLKTRLAWAVMVGVFCCNAVSIKYTGLATPALVGLEAIFGIWFLKRSYPFPDLLVILTTAFFLYAAYFKIHFDLLPLTGDGDAFMPVEFQRTLINNTNYDPNAVKPGFWPTMFELNREMVVGSNGITQRHPWDSVWYEWLLNLRGVAYYSHDYKHTFTAAVYLLGNPLVIWPVFVCIVSSLIFAGVYLRYRSWVLLKMAPFAPYFSAISFCAAGYIWNLYPYVFVARSCFLYHYMPALQYAHIMTAVLMQALFGASAASPNATTFGKTAMTWVLRVWTGLMVFGYLFYFGWIYCFPLTNEGHERRRWLPRWN